MIFLIHSVLAFPAAGWVPLLQHWYYCITVLLTQILSMADTVKRNLSENSVLKVSFYDMVHAVSET